MFIVLFATFSGYPIIQHTGSTYGYRAIITMVPSLNIGIFTALTGADPNYMFRVNGHLFIIDLLLGHEPWVNKENVCTFPSPWRPKTHAPYPRPQTDLAPKRELTEYQGLYANPGYGQLEIFLNDTTNKLMCNFGFGTFVLHPKAKLDEFFAQGVGLMENIRDFSTFRFVFSNRTVSELVVPSFESKDPPVFSLVLQDRDKRETNTGATVTYNRFTSVIITLTALVLVSISVL